MSRAIGLQFTVECPHCGKKQKMSLISTGEICGDGLSNCRNCKGNFVVVWALELEANVFKCDPKPSDVDVTYDLSEIWSESEDLDLET
jgi:hypothetical protein